MPLNRSTSGPRQFPWLLESGPAASPAGELLNLSTSFSFSRKVFFFLFFKYFIIFFRGTPLWLAFKGHQKKANIHFESCDKPIPGGCQLLKARLHWLLVPARNSCHAKTYFTSYFASRTYRIRMEEPSSRVILQLPPLVGSLLITQLSGRLQKSFFPTETERQQQHASNIRSKLPSQPCGSISLFMYIYIYTHTHTHTHTHTPAGVYVSLHVYSVCVHIYIYIYIHIYLYISIHTYISCILQIYA